MPGLYSSDIMPSGGSLQNANSLHILRRGGGGLAGTRTQDQRLKRPLLYRLSYQPVNHAGSIQSTEIEPEGKVRSERRAN